MTKNRIYKFNQSKNFSYFNHLFKFLPLFFLFSPFFLTTLSAGGLGFYDPETVLLNFPGFKRFGSQFIKNQVLRNLLSRVDSKTAKNIIQMERLRLKWSKGPEFEREKTRLMQMSPLELGKNVDPLGVDELMREVQKSIQKVVQKKGLAGSLSARPEFNPVYFCFHFSEEGDITKLKTFEGSFFQRDYLFGGEEITSEIISELNKRGRN